MGVRVDVKSCTYGQITRDQFQHFLGVRALSVRKMNTHTRIHLTAVCPGLPRWVGIRNVKPSKRQWHQLGHMQVCPLLQAHNHASTPPLSVFTGQMSFLPSSQQCQSTEGSIRQYNKSGCEIMYVRPRQPNYAWPTISTLSSASEVTTLRHYTNLFIIIIISALSVRKMTSDWTSFSSLRKT